MKHAAKRRGVSTRAFVALLAVVLVIGCVVGGTVAWLTVKTDDVVNTFTFGNIDITLAEKTEGPYKIVPGKTITKDPKVTVEAGSEDCYLFVKVVENNWPDFKEADETTRKVSYKIADGWNVLDATNYPGVYYREVNYNATTAQGFSVLADDQVTVSSTLTKAEVNSVKDKAPTLTFTAYAIQKDGTGTAAEAWAKI